jgi:tetratricopeptide (TPR) repeat protein
MSAVKILREDPCSPDFKPLEEALHAWEIRRSNPKESHRRAKLLIEHALEFDQPLVTAWAYLTCGAHEVAANELDEAEESLASAKTLFIRGGEQRGESLATVLCARVQISRGEFHAALEMYKSIIEREAHGLRTLERFEAFNAIAGCFWAMDKIELCLLYLSKAFDTLRNTSHNAERATVLSNMAAALMTVGNHEAAKEFLLAAQQFSKGCDDRVLQLNILTSLAAIHLEFKNVDDAVRVSANILTNFEDLAFAGPTNTSLCNAAMSFALGKQWTLSDQCLVGAQLIAQEAGLPTSRIQVAQAEAEIASARGNYAVASAHAESVLADFDQHLSSETRSQLYALLATCYQKQSRLEDLLSVKKKKLALSEGRYQSGLAAAMVILDLKSSLRQILA